jgi:DNA polymerase-3 subunit delta'
MTGAALETLQRSLCPWLKGALNRLETAYAAQRLGHAWLIGGPAGSGKLNLALVFARRLLERGAKLELPDLAPRKPSPRTRIDTRPPTTIPICTGCSGRGQDCDLGRADSRPSRGAEPQGARGGAKLVIFEPADGMTTAAANALLKSLEEPSADTYLLLLADQPGRLPATIRSRCQRLDVARPTPSRSRLGSA